MKKALFVLACLVSLIHGAAVAAEPSEAGAADRFYGKITAIDHNQRNLTVHNKKQKMDAQFQWNQQTAMVFNKKAIPATELKVGQSLIVSYVTENDLNQAKKITVRTPFKKAQEN